MKKKTVKYLLCAALSVSMTMAQPLSIMASEAGNGIQAETAYEETVDAAEQSDAETEAAESLESGQGDNEGTSEEADVSDERTETPDSEAEQTDEAIGGGDQVTSSEMEEEPEVEEAALQVASDSEEAMNEGDDQTDSDNVDKSVGENVKTTDPKKDDPEDPESKTKLYQVPVNPQTELADGTYKVPFRMMAVEFGFHGFYNDEFSTPAMLPESMGNMTFDGRNGDVNTALVTVKNGSVSVTFSWDQDMGLYEFQWFDSKEVYDQCVTSRDFSALKGGIPEDGIVDSTDYGDGLVHTIACDATNQASYVYHADYTPSQGNGMVVNSIKKMTFPLPSKAPGIYVRLAAAGMGTTRQKAYVAFYWNEIVKMADKTTLQKYVNEINSRLDDVITEPAYANGNFVMASAYPKEVSEGVKNSGLLDRAQGILDNEELTENEQNTVDGVVSEIENVYKNSKTLWDELKAIPSETEELNANDYTAASYNRVKTYSEVMAKLMPDEYPYAQFFALKSPDDSYMAIFVNANLYNGVTLSQEEREVLALTKPDGTAYSTDPEDGSTVFNEFHPSSDQNNYWTGETGVEPSYANRNQLYVRYQQYVSELVSNKDLENLEAEVANAKAISGDKYTAESFKALTDAIKAAENVLANEDATKTEVDGALQTLKDAESGLAEKPAATPTPTATATPAPTKASDGTDVGTGAGVAYATEKITASASDEGPTGTVYGKIQLKMKKAAKKSITVKWNKVSGATGYIVFGAKSGKSNKFAKLATTTATSYKQTGLKKGTYYKYMVMAVKDGTVVSTSKTIYVATTGGKYTNAKKVTVAKKKLTVKKGKTVKIKKAKAVKAASKKTKNYRKVKYETSDASIATVTSKGKVKGVNKGTCYIYVYAQDGAVTKVKVKVK